MHMPLVLTNRRRRGGSASAPAFSPTSLYSSGSQGIWLDPSDLSTMFSDRAGTIQVTTPGTVVGKRLDKSGRGNHATAPTDAARPIYGVEPKGGRRNLLTWSEDFGNAAWTKTGVTPSGGTLSATAGGSFHSATQAQTTSGSNATASVLVKAGTSNFVWMTLSPSFGTGNYATAVANLATGAVTKTQSGGTLTGATAGISGPDALGFYRVTLSAANPSTSMSAIIGISNGATPTITSYGSVEFSAAGTETIITGGAQLELGSTATNYQRVTTAYDITESGVATCHYVQYDGSDDSMSTAAIDFTATDKMSVFAGVRKLSDNVVFGVLTELSANAGNGNPGSLAIFAPSTFGTPTYQAFSARSVASALDMTTFAAPISNVLAVLFNNAGLTRADAIKPRVNGAVPTISGGFNNAPGTGNFGNYPLFIGRRNNATLPFNGKDYGIIIVGKAASAGEITDTETWLAARTAQVTI